MADKRRNLLLTFTPEVSVDGMEVVVSTGRFQGGTKWQCKGALSMHCAARLVRDLRKAMHEIRRTQIRSMNAAITEAEQEIQ